MRSVIVSSLALLLCSAAVSAGYDAATANSSVWLSAAAYCETNTYLTRTFKGYSTGFVASYVIDDKSADVQVDFFRFDFFSHFTF